MTDDTATRRLVAFTRRTRFDTLPHPVVHDTKRVILDTVGCAVGGHATASGRIVVRVQQALRGAPVATILGTADRTSAPCAAFTNAELANVLDADETLFMIGHHANCIVAVALAVGQQVGATGQDVLAAVAVGYDVAARVGLSLDVRQRPGEGVEFSPLSGNGWIIFGCASAAGMLLGLSDDELMNAFGIAATCAPIPYLGRWERAAPTNRAMTKYAFYGPIAENGVRAALLAKEGFLGEPDILDGDVGFWRLTGARGVNEAFLTGELGTRWWIQQTAFKAYPGCRHGSIAVDLLAEIVKTHEIRPDDIESMVVRANPVLAERAFDAFPSNEVDMLFSLSYLLAIAVLEEFRPSPAWVDPKHLADERVRRLASRITLARHAPATQAIREQLARDGLYTRVPTEVEVRAGGRVFVAAAEYAKGDPWSPTSRMTDDELAAKFRWAAGDRLGPRRSEATIQRIMSLDKVDRIEDLMTAMTG